MLTDDFLGPDGTVGDSPQRVLRRDRPATGNIHTVARVVACGTHRLAAAADFTGFGTFGRPLRRNLSGRPLPSAIDLRER